MATPNYYAIDSNHKLVLKCDSEPTIPVMTSATTPRGVVSCTSEDSTNKAWKAFDGSTSGRWESVGNPSSTPQELKYDYGVGNEKVVTSASVSSMTGYQVQSPYNFTLDGSNDDSNWTNFVTVTGATWGNPETKVYKWTNTTAYRYVRLRCTSANAGLYVVVERLQFNDVFIDSSADNHEVIQAPANIKQVPYELDRQAIWFNGTDSYLSVPDSTDWDFGTGNFTFETFFMLTSVSNTQCIFDSQDGNGGSGGVRILWESSNCINVTIKGNARIGTGSAPFTPVVGVWYHLAVVRKGTGTNELAIYIGGASIGTGTSNDNITGSSGAFQIGKAGATSTAWYFGGWMKEIRVSNSARYTGAFTVPTAKFVSDANTKLLIHGSTGANAPLGPAIYFDGTGDRLTLASSSDWALGSDFTVESYIRMDSVSGYQTICGTYWASNSGWYSTVYLANPYIYTGSTNYTITEFTCVPNVWYHIAWSRSGTDLRCFVDGKQYGSTKTDSSTFPENSGLAIGDVIQANTPLTGYLKELRISNVARYTSNFTPSKTGFTVDANTKLYIKGNEDNGVTGVGAIDKFEIGDSRVYPFCATYAGSPGYELGIGQTFFASGSYAMTGVQFNVAKYGTNAASFKAKLYAVDGSHLPTGSALAESGVYAVDDTPQSYPNDAFTQYDFVTPYTLTQGVEYAVVLEYESGTRTAGAYLEVRMESAGTYTNGMGISKGSNGSWTESDSTNHNKYQFRAIYAGGYFLDYETSPKTITPAGNTIIKYVEDYRHRIVADSGNTGHYPTCLGGAKVDFTAPFGTAAAFCLGPNGSGAGGLTVNPEGDFDFGTDDFCFEIWARSHSTYGGGYGGLFGKSNESGSSYFWIVDNGASGKYEWWTTDMSYGHSILGPVVPPYTWTHVCVTRKGSNGRLFINGTLVDSCVSASALTNWSNPLRVGYLGAWNAGFIGILDEARVSRTVARYTNTFNPPEYLLITSSIKSVSGVLYANIGKVSSISKASMGKVAGLA